MALAPYSPNQASARAKETWQRFSSGFTPGQKAVTLAALVGLVAAAAFLSSHMSSPSYQPLFSGLQPSSAAAITADLPSAKVPYKLANGGTTIEVPAAKVDQERLTLAAAGTTSISQLVVATDQAQLATQLTVAIQNAALTAFNTVLNI